MSSPRSVVPITRIDREQARALEVAPWDRIAPARARDLDSGRDLSFDHVIAPTVLELVGRRKGALLDVGCGTGRLTRRLAGPGRTVLGIDPSTVSALYAADHVADLPDVEIRPLPIGDLEPASVRPFSTVVASMVLQDVVELSAFLGRCADLLKPTGRLVIAMTHPHFWPSYWGYSRQSWFAYEKELFLRTEFRTSVTSSGIETMHCHRPLSLYAAELKRAGFAIADVREPVLPKKVQHASGVTWREPHFLFLECRRAR